MAACHMKVSEADFRVYSKSEILELSVHEIHKPETFDMLQNPVVGGLHDPALGPCRRDDRCESCGQMESHCPGHMGHIKLPVLCFNPMFFKILLKILKGSCFSCHKFNLSSLQKQLFSHQMALLQKGYLTASQDLVERFKNSEKGEAETLSEMKAHMEHILTNAEKDGNVTSKNVLSQFQSTVGSILKTFAAVKPNCVHCRTRNRILKAEYNRTIVGTMTEAKRSSVKTKAKDSDDEDAADNEAGEPSEDIDMDGQEGETAEEARKEENVPLDSEILSEMEDFLRSPHKRCILSPNVAKEHLKLLWQVDKEFMSGLLPFLSLVKGAETPTDVFFLDVIPVPPSRFRPLSVMKDRKYEHPQTANLANVLRECVTLRDLLQTYTKMDTNAPGPSMPQNLASHMQKIMSSWLRLQSRVNVVFDSDLDKISMDKNNGIKQLLEKKEGLFRMHMMGKRVNFAARSVISPDPYIATREIGIPMVFASKLTYPQRVTAWNVQQLRQMVINGPLGYPGASSVINEDGSVIRLHPTKATQREAIAKQLLVRDKDVSDSKIVCRHLINGDYLLLNRQPTLHRPSIQAHRARVLPNIKTLRMHYSNCKAYNADFDGDEMNAHFPQCELSRAEANQIALTDNQYLVPRDASPLAGLIQDHMVAGVGLTVRGRFFNREDYCQLVWSAMNDFREKIHMLPPSIIKPVPLWSGKQIVSTILLNTIPKDKVPLNLKSKAKIPEKSWAKWLPQLPLNVVNTEELGESTVVVRQGELLQGVLDKAQSGPAAYGLVHCCYELYGGDVAGRLLTYIGRLCTSFLQKTGFSLGVGDILVRRKANKKRKHLIKRSQHVGVPAILKALGLPSPVSPDHDETTERDILLELKKAHFDKNANRMAEIDMCMKGETDKIQDGIAKCIMPGGLEKGFPSNSLQLMVQSGAKGSPVNCMQISCLLGQIELEGRRPPLMLSGRSLPSFLPYDVSPKAGGFVTGRFLTGIRPQEYFFHCMAGREGLIDTAVKTSRSGYLQRCLVKHLEGLMVNYDMTVRDSDGTMIQFYYGEDGIEPIRSPFLKPSLFPFLAENVGTLLGPAKSMAWLQKEDKSVRRTWKKISKWNAKAKEDKQFIKRESGFLEFCKGETAPQVTTSEMRTPVTAGRFMGRSEASKKLVEAWESMDPDERENCCSNKTCPDPVMSMLAPHSKPDVLSEKFRHLLNVFCKKGLAKVAAQDVNPRQFKLAMNKKVVESLAHPGEVVGLVCAQSIGEPSTQMTLNTFHFAGRGEMNVTLGIPRLREILMTGSANIKTPSMDVPLRPTEQAKVKAAWLHRHLTRVTLDQVMEYLKLKMTTRKSQRGTDKVIEAKLKFLPHRDYSGLTNVTPLAVLRFVVKRFLPSVHSHILKELQLMEKSSFLSSGRLRRTKLDNEDADDNLPPPPANAEDNDDDLDLDPNNDGDMGAVKEAQRQTDTQEYEGEEEEREELGTDRKQDDEDDEEQSRPESPNDEKKEDEVIEEEDSSDDEAEMNIEDMSVMEKELVQEALTHAFIEDFKFDQKKVRWCVITFKYDQNSLPLDVCMLFEKVVRASCLHQVSGVTRAFLSEVQEDGEAVTHLRTEGVNIQEMFKYPDVLDLNRLHSNCIHTMATTYGVEAANRVIIKEIQGVFGAYGINVDYRHLSLLADYMTARGEYDAFNRRDISFNTSPLQKMTFETTMHFLLDACQAGSKDKLESPSAQIVLGKPVSAGTNCFEILDPLCA